MATEVTMDWSDLQARDSTLMSPLGWAASEFLVLAEERPQLGLHLLTAPRPRVHLLAFVMAMSAGKLVAGVLEDALRRPTREVLADFGFAELRGLRRLL